MSSFEAEYQDAYKKVIAIKKEYFTHMLEEYNQKLLEKVENGG